MQNPVDLKLNPVACETCSVISDPVTSGVTLADAEATGTIRNTGAMPQAWIARFGRAVSQRELVFGWSFNLTAWAAGPGSVTVSVWRPGAFGLPEHAAGRRRRPELLEQLVTDGRHAPGTSKRPGNFS